ncbi:MAG TPA: SpoIIE family protein phosphatase [Gammaproteobacteria bacterium]|nr:SpoIIE family protein phosphatase [Gammaproteobacteria bacterium]
MGLRIRTKLLLLLLAIALVPLTVIGWLDYRALRSLGIDLAAQSQKALTERAQQELSQTTVSDALLIQRQREILELLIRDQAREVETRLALPPTGIPGTPDRVIFDTDLDAGKVPPDRTEPMPGANGGAMPITYKSQIFRIPPGGAVSEFRGDINRLVSMSDVYREIYASHNDVILRHYTTLQSGLHSVYPGRGGYPADYDPRTRPWYQHQLQTPGLAWSPPLVDVVSGEVTLGLSMPVRAPDGNFAGVTAMDISLQGLFSRVPLPSGWAAESNAFVVVADHDPGDGQHALKVLARQSYETAARDWHTVLSTEWLTPEPASAGARLITDTGAHRAGMIKALYRGVESLWAYRPLEDDGSILVLIVPYARAIEHAESVHAMALDATAQQLKTTAAIAVLAAALVVLVALLSARTVTRPLHHLVDVINRVTRGDLKARARLDTGDEWQRLAEGFNTMVPQLQELLQLNQSLQLAREVQQNLIPQSPPRSTHFDIAGRTIYCEETGGDYYDFLDLSESRIGVVIGDVSGHGISSALVMTAIRALLHGYTQQGLPLATLMSAINTQLAKDMPSGRFMTLFYLIADAGERTCRWVSAGHDPAIFYCAATGAFHELVGQDIPIGVESYWNYRESIRPDIADGSLLFFGTDGVWETRNSADETYGKERIRNLLRAHARESAEEICTALIADLQTFRGAQAQLDDLTVVVLKVKAFKS